MRKQGNREVINALGRKRGGKDYGSKQENAERKLEVLVACVECCLLEARVQGLEFQFSQWMLVIWGKVKIASIR
jgi:hypothetical protein